MRDRRPLIRVYTRVPRVVPACPQRGPGGGGAARLLEIPVKPDIRVPRPRVLSLRGGVLLAPLLLGACELESLSVGEAGVNAHVRFMNAARGAPAMTLFLDDHAVVEGVTYGTVSSYVPIRPALYSLRMEVPRTQQSADVAVPLVSATFRPVAGTSYTLFAAGPATSPLAMVAIDTGVVPAAGRVKLRAIHAAPAAPPIDVHLTGSSGSVSPSTRVVFPFTFGTGTFDSFPGYVERTPGSYRVVVTRQGTAEVLLDVSLTVTAGQTRSVVVLDGAAGGLIGRVLEDRN